MRKLLPVLLILCAGAAWGQSGELWFDAGASILSNNGIGSSSPAGTPNDIKLDNGFRFGFRFGINSSRFFGHEVQYAYSRTHLLSSGVDAGGMGIHTGGYNFLGYGMPEGSRIRLFGTAGVHFSNFVPPGSSALSGGGTTKFGINYGAGVKVKLTSLWAARFDIRRYETPKPFDLFQQQGWLHQTEVSTGVGFLF